MAATRVVKGCQAFR